MVKWEKSKVIHCDHNKIVSMKVKKAVNANYTTILFEFVPMGEIQAHLEEGGGYVLKIKRSKKYIVEFWLL
jgi:hypothetical protein